MRMIAVFEKSERIRHIGHLDIQRFVQRGLRRSELPVAYSKGFNPHILVTFASALSTGACGLREIMDVTLAEPVPEQEFLSRMNRAMPPEMQLLEARAVDDRHPALMATLRAASYDLRIRDPRQAEKLVAAIPVLMSREQIPALRKTKTGMKEVDIKPLIFALSGREDHLYCTLALTEGSACKPNMLLEALCREAGIRPQEQESPAAPDPASVHDGCPEAAEGAPPAQPEARPDKPPRTDSFGNAIAASASAAPDRSGPVRVLVTRTCLLGENEEGVLLPLERL